MYVEVTYNEFKMFNGLCRKHKKTKRYSMPKYTKLDMGMIEIVYMDYENIKSCNIIEKKDYYLIGNVLECKIYE